MDLSEVGLEYKINFAYQQTLAIAWRWLANMRAEHRRISCGIVLELHW